MEVKYKGVIKIQKKNIEVVINIIIGIASAILVCYTGAANLFSVVDFPTTITIRGTAQCNKDSYGTDVRIKNIMVDGEILELNEMQKNGNWIYSEDSLIAIAPQHPVTVCFDASNARKMELTMVKQMGSGIVEVWANDRFLTEVDLYSSEYTVESIKLPLTYIKISSNIIAFIIIVCGCTLFIFFVNKQLRLMKNDLEVRKLCRILSIPMIFWLVGALIFHHIRFFIVGSVCILLFISIIFPIKAILKKNGIVVISIGLKNILFLITAILMWYVVENVNTRVIDFDGHYFIANIVIYCFIVLSLYAVTKRISFSVIVAMIIAFVYSVSNYYVVQFRGSPIVPSDFFSVGIATTVMKNYQYKLTWNIYNSFFIVVVWGILVNYIAADMKKIKVKEQIIVATLTLSLLSIILKADLFKPVLDFWNLNISTKQYGLALSFVSNFRRMRVEPPQGYSESYLDILYEEYFNDENSMINDFEPNIIVIMNESFSDLNSVASVLDSNDYLSYYNNLYENTIKGKAFVSTIGGGTCNSEYEFLTGNSIGFVPGSFPYQQFIHTNRFSLARELKEEGYSTVALHPYNKSGYNRPKVYSYLGFDEFYSIEDFQDPELSRERYVTDRENYKKVIELFEKYDEKGPLFLFNVTMQNHSGYNTNYFGENVIQVPQYEGKYPDVEEYLTLIDESDKAIQILVEYFSKIEEPTVVVMFGDHQPKMSDDFYKDMFEKNMTEWTLEEQQKRYEVPFFIWSNFDIEEKDGLVTSLNYLSSLVFDEIGMDMGEYRTFLLKLSKTIPAMNINGYIGDDGYWHTYTEENEIYTSQLENYWKLQYNNMFSREKNIWFSFP